MLMNARKTATKLVSKVIKKHGKLRFFYTCRAYHSILDDSNTMGSNLWKFLTIARWWNLPVNCPVIHCMCNIELTRQKTSNLRLCRLRFLSSAQLICLFCSPFMRKQQPLTGQVSSYQATVVHSLGSYYLIVRKSTVQPFWL